MNPAAVHASVPLTIQNTDDCGVHFYRHQARLEYHSSDPLAVQVDFGNDTVWVFARDVLRDGLSATAGQPAGYDPQIGDIYAWVSDDELWLSLRSPDGTGLMWFEVADIQGFLAATARLVPFGAEAAHLDFETGRPFGWWLR